MSLDYHFERLLRGGNVGNYAEIARRMGLSRAQVTQIVDLMLLALHLQEKVLLAGGRSGLSHVAGSPRRASTEWHTCTAFHRAPARSRAR